MVTSDTTEKKKLFRIAIRLVALRWLRWIKWLLSYAMITYICFVTIEKRILEWRSSVRWLHLTLQKGSFTVFRMTTLKSRATKLINPPLVIGLASHNQGQFPTF